MKALLSKAVGGPETLVFEDVPSPEAKPGFAVVQVKAVGVNFPDVLIIEDKYQFKPARPFAPGGEISGIVKSVGEGVTNVKPGDRVLGNTGWGGMAEELALEAQRLVKIPESMPFDDAAAFIMTYGTSYHALKDRANLQAGRNTIREIPPDRWSLDDFYVADVDTAVEQGKSYCRPIEPPPEAPPYCTRSLGVVDCWRDPAALPDRPPEVSAGPRVLTPEQEANRTRRWPDF